MTSKQSVEGFAPPLLDALYSGSADQLCKTASELCGNPVFFLSFNFRVLAYDLHGSRQPDLAAIAESGAVGPEYVNFLHDRFTLSRISAGEILQIPSSGLRFLCIPIMQTGIHVASVLVFQDQAEIQPEDRELMAHVAKCLRLLSPDLNAPGTTRLIYEYALIRTLQDDFDPDREKPARFLSTGYRFKQNLYMAVMDHAHSVDVNSIRQQLNTICGHIRRIIGNYGLCTPFRDHVIVLLNLDNDRPLSKILNDFRLFSLRNSLRVGISPRFSEASELKRNYRYALDAIGIGSIIYPDNVIHDFTDLRVYKFIATCSRSFSPTDLVPEYLDQLIRYDHETGSNLLETLYYYVYTVKNTKKAAELMHVHRNTLLYRLEKIRSIIHIDPDDGDSFLQLMLSFKFLEFRALQTGHPLCFKPIRNTPSWMKPEED